MGSEWGKRRERETEKKEAGRQEKGESEKREPTDSNAWHPDSLLPEFIF